MKIKVYDQSGKAHGDTEFGFQSIGVSRQLIQDAVVAFRANQRQGNASTKTKGEVSGSGKKPWRQKGTGRARSGGLRSPLWRHGGIVFGPKPRDYSKRVPKGMKRAAFLEALVQRAEAGDLIVLRELKLSSPKTREFAAIVNKLPLEGKKSLFVYGERDANLLLAGRNMPAVEIVSAESLNVYQVLNFNKIVMTEGALKRLQGRLSGREEGQ